MKIEHKIRVEDLGLIGKSHTNKSRIVVDVFCDGLECGSVVVASGPKNDILELLNDDITMQQLQERWAPKTRVRISPTSHELVAEDEETGYPTQRSLSGGKWSP